MTHREPSYPQGLPGSPETRERGKFRRTDVYGLTAVAVTGPGPDGGEIPTSLDAATEMVLELRRTNRLLELLVSELTGRAVEVSLSDVA